MFHAGSRYRLVSILLVASLVALGSYAIAQDVNADGGQGVSTSSQGQASQQSDPLKRPIGDSHNNTHRASPASFCAIFCYPEGRCGSCLRVSGCPASYTLPPVTSNEV